MTINLKLVSFMLTIICIASCSASHAQNSLLQTLSTDGFALTAGTKTILPGPLLAGSTGNSAKPGEETQTRLTKLAQKYGWERFSKNSPTAPVQIELNYVQSASGERLGHQVYSAFIAYVPLASLRDQQLISAMFGSSSDDQQQIGFATEEVPAAILQSVGIEKIDSDNVRYSTLRIPLMNRVLIEGTARIEKLESESSITLVWQLDEHFTFSEQTQLSEEMAKYANRYQKTERNELGQLVEAKPVSYSGFGGYVSVQATGLVDKQVLFESRFAMHEPQQWFAGSNFLRSKFPSALQESAQNFRRKLAPKGVQ